MRRKKESHSPPSSKSCVSGKKIIETKNVYKKLKRLKNDGTYFPVRKAFNLIVLKCGSLLINDD